MHRTLSRGDCYLVAHPGAELYGSDRVMLESVVGFVESGKKVVVTLPEEGPLVDHLTAAGAIVEIAPAFVLRKSLLHPRRWPLLVSSVIRGWRSARRLLREHAPAVVYVSTVTLPLWPFAARRAGIPSVIHIHEAEQHARRIVKKVLYAPARRADAVLLNSKFARSVLEQAYPDLAERAVIVYNGVAGPDVRVPARADLTAPVRLVYVGRLSPRKGPDLIVDALTLLPVGMADVRLDLVGAVFSGYEWYEDELSARITALGLDDRVTKLGFCSDVWEAISRSDIVIVPSRFDEPFGNTAVEGVLAGRVVVVSDTSGLREAIEGVTTAQHFVADDAHSLAHAIERAVDRWPTLRPRLEMEADHAGARFSPARYRAEVTASLAAIATPDRDPSPASHGTT